MRITRLAAVLLLATGLALAGCAKSTATPATLTAAEKAALPTLEKCVPNGHAVIPAVLSGHASLLNAGQLAEAFRTKAARHRIMHCALPSKAARNRAENCTLHAVQANGAGHGKARADLISALACIQAAS